MKKAKDDEKKLVLKLLKKISKNLNKLDAINITYDRKDEFNDILSHENQILSETIEFRFNGEIKWKKKLDANNVII